MLGVGFYIILGYQTRFEDGRVQTEFEDGRVQGFTESNDSEFQPTPHPVQQTVVVYFVPYKIITFKFFMNCATVPVVSKAQLLIVLL